MNSPGCINHYRYTITPPPRSSTEEKWVLQQLWPELTNKLGNFVVQCSRDIFSPSSLAEDVQKDLAGDPAKGYEAHTVKVTFSQMYTADEVNKGALGEAEVVAQHIVHKLAEPLMYNRVGRRYFNNEDAMDGKAQLTIFSGFYAALNSMGRTAGPQLQLDIMNRAVHKRNIIESLSLDDSLVHDSHEVQSVQSEWRRRCLGATVVTVYNNRMYRIKAVHFDKTPESKFTMYQRDMRKKELTSYQEYYRAYYDKDIVDLKQPLLEAFPEKESERVFLVPELCSLTGLSDDMRKDKNLLVEAMKQTKVYPQDRLSAIQDLAHRMATFAEPSHIGSGPSSCAQCLQDWKVRLESSPVEVEARVLEPLEVSFGPGKRFQIEDGSFQRFMRNGLQCPTRFDDWLFIYPETDLPVLDIWLRSLRDIAQVAFAMKMGDPVRIMCTEQRENLKRVLEERLTPTTQMVLLLTPQKDCKRVYQLFKQITCTRFPCVTQVVKSETVRKRQSIAAILSRIVLQINAKFCGPLWHIDLAADVTAPLFAVPTMALGIDVFHSCDGERCVGFAASLDRHCAEYYSRASMLEGGDARGTAKSISLKLQDFMQEALLHFARRNDGLLPEHIVAYRASARQQDWPVLLATEVEALQAVLSAVDSAGPRGERYAPKLTFLAIAQRVGMRFFASGASGAKSPEPGTVVDGPAATRSDTVNFYLVNQHAAKGTANPTHYTVLHDTANLHPNVLQNLSYRLSFLYFNNTSSVKMPAPAQYAKKIAHLVGTAVRTDPNRRLLCTFFYL